MLFARKQLFPLSRASPRPGSLPGPWLTLLILVAGVGLGSIALADEPTPKSAPHESSSRRDGQLSAASIGRRIFLDPSLSHPPGQACVSCHNPASAFADPRATSPGAVPGRVGTRNAPTLMYTALIPSRAYEDLLTREGEEIFVWEGGLFQDGRARDQFEQVQQPFFDPNEMNIPDQAALATRLRMTNYAAEFRSWIGESAWTDDTQLSYHAYRALVEFLKEPLFRPFDSRLDDFLQGDQSALNDQEKRGLDLFRNAARCADCHLLEADSWPEPLLSDFGYDNLGVPSRGNMKDPGLGKVTRQATESGMFRAPTLRNVTLTAPYMHNGSIASLREVIEFYNKRDLEPDRWGPTDYPETVNHDDLGNLELIDQQVDDLLALMDAFTDRTLLSDKVRHGDFPRAPPDAHTTKAKSLHFPDWTHRLHSAFQPESADRTATP